MKSILVRLYTKMDYTKMTLEGAVSLILLSIAYKIYRMKIHSSSKCCGDRLQFETDNTGSPETGVNELVSMNPENNV